MKKGRHLPTEFSKNNADYDILEVRKIVTKLAAFALNIKASKVSPDQALFSSQKAFDSFAMLELIIRLEEAFQISIPDEDLDSKVIYSVNTITAYIYEKLRGGD